MLELKKISKLEGETILLRPFCLEDAKSVFNNWGKDPVATKYMLWKNYETIEDAKKAIIYYIDCYNNNSSFRQYAIVYKETNEVIGSISIDISKRHHHADLGYVLSQRMWNKGIMTEAIRCIVDYCFKELGCVRVSADVMEKNIGSRKLLEKCGFTLEGIARKKFLTKDNEFVNSYIYAIIKE